MKNGTITLNLFTALDRIANEKKINDGEWAKAAGMKYASRVAELRWKAKLEMSGQKPKKVGRAFTVPKLTALIRGLQILVGGDELNRQLLKHMEDAATRLERVLFMVLALAQEETDLEQLEMYCQMMIRAGSTRDKKSHKPVKHTK